MAQTRTTVTSIGMVHLGRSLNEPEHIEHNGGLYSVKLQNTFQTVNRDIIAVWVIDQFLRPSGESQP